MEIPPVSFSFTFFLNVADVGRAARCFQGRQIRQCPAPGRPRKTPGIHHPAATGTRPLGLSLKTFDTCSSAAGSYIKGQSTIETARSAGIWSVISPYIAEKGCAHTGFLIVASLAC